LRLGYTTKAGIRANELELQESNHRVRLGLEVQGGQGLLLNVTEGEPKRRTPDPQDVLMAATRRWRAWFAAAPEVEEPLRAQYYFAWWVLGVNLIALRFCPHYQGVVPSKLGYVGVWHWDAYFHALALRHVDMRLAKDQFRILLEHQLASGMIPDVVHDGGVLAFSSDMVAGDAANSLKYVGADSVLGRRMMQTPITKPPLTAWASWKLYEFDGDVDFITEIYDRSVRSQAWWFRENDVDGNGLPEYQHPYSSGIDDSPLWDEGPPVESPDLSSYLALQYDHLAKLALVLDKGDEAARWRRQAEGLVERLIRLRWDEEAGLFWASRLGKRVGVRTPFNLYPLITGRLPRAVADKVVATLTDETQFWSRHPVPTVALDDPRFDPERMWRGPMWLNPNYLLIDGLFRAGYPEVADSLRRRTLDLITRDGGDMNEYYNPLSGAKPPGATTMFGWTAALFIDLAVAAAWDGDVDADPVAPSKDAHREDIQTS